MRISDWSSDVCSSDLVKDVGRLARRRHPQSAALAVETTLPFGISGVQFDAAYAAVGTKRDMILARDLNRMFDVADDIVGAGLSARAQERHEIAAGDTALVGQGGQIGVGRVARAGLPNGRASCRERGVQRG